MPVTPISRLPAVRRGALVALAAALLATALAAPASAAPPAYRGASLDGEVVFFESEEKLVPGDTDNRRDIYGRSFEEGVGEGGEGAYVTRQVSVGPAGGNDAYHALFERASDDGSKVFFTTEERLVAGDTDRESDVYVRDIEAGSTTLVSIGADACAPACGNDLFDAGLAGRTGDGTRAYVVTAERLDPAVDTDSAVDVYERNLDPLSEETKLVSRGAASCAPGCGNGDANAILREVSADGSTAIFVTEESLAGGDTDQTTDVYARDLANGVTILVSQGDPSCPLPCGNSGVVPVYSGSSSDGQRVFFSTGERLAAADEDTATDVYARDLPAGPTTFVSDGAAGGGPASFAAASTDGGEVFFTTVESLVGAGDGNGATDVYLWSGGAPQLITSGNCPPSGECGSGFGAATPDGTAVVFTTFEKLVADDEDASLDVYLQTVGAGSPVLVSAGADACAPVCGNGATPAAFNRISDDGSKGFFTTVEQLSPLDIDGVADIYARDLDAGATTLSSPPPGLCPVTDCPATFLAGSTDGAHAFFLTAEWLVSEDSDEEADIYERAFDATLGKEVTRLVSTGNSEDLDLGPEAPVLIATDPASPAASTTPAVLGTAEAGSSIKLYTTPDCSGEPAATGSAEQLASPGIAVTVAADSTTSIRATAEAEGFVSLCSAPIAYEQKDPEPPPGGGDPGDGGSGGGGSGNSGGASGGGDPSAPAKTHSGGIAYLTPATRITFGPASRTRARRPVFRFTDSTGQPGTQFFCKVDRGRWKGCGSPVRLARLSAGRHVFNVRGLNAAGEWESQPSKRAFKVVAR